MPYKFNWLFKISKTNPLLEKFYIIYSSVYPCLIFDSDRYGLTTVVLIGFEVETASSDLMALNLSLNTNCKYESDNKHVKC